MKDTLDNAEVERRALQLYIDSGQSLLFWHGMDPIEHTHWKLLAAEDLKWERRVSTAVRSSDT